MSSIWSYDGGSVGDFDGDRWEVLNGIKGTCVFKREVSDRSVVDARGFLNR